MSVELPKDREGREIPLDTEALYDKSGERLAIYAWEYMPQLKYVRWRVRFLFDDSGCKYYPDEYYLAPPDSWEKLEEDLDGCIEKDEVCCYYNKNKDCRSCPISGNNPNGCISEVFKDVKKRICKLRGEGNV